MPDKKDELILSLVTDKGCFSVKNFCETSMLPLGRFVKNIILSVRFRFSLVCFSEKIVCCCEVIRLKNRHCFEQLSVNLQSAMSWIGSATISPQPRRNLQLPEWSPPFSPGRSQSAAAVELLENDEGECGLGALHELKTRTSLSGVHLTTISHLCQQPLAHHSQVHAMSSIESSRYKVEVQ